MVTFFCLFLLFLYCLYFIKNPYFKIKKIPIKRSLEMLITEISLGIIVFLFILLPIKQGIIVFFLSESVLLCVLLELWFRVPAINLDNRLKKEERIMLVDEARKDFKFIVPIVVILTLMMLFNFLKW